MVLTLDRWKGKVAVVTGASAGIGIKIVEQLVEEGILVVGLARRVNLIEDLAKKLQDKKGKLYALKADVSVEDDVIKAFKWTEENLGPIHILINNAGVLQDTNLIDGETQKWKTLFDINVLGLCIATREAVRSMRANKIDGHIIHIGSVSGHQVNYFPCMNVYAASKHAVRALTETLRRELITIGSKIKVTVISPGCIESEIFDTIKSEELRKATVEWTKNWPALAAQDIADALFYTLASSPNCQVHDIIVKPIGELF